MDLVVDCVDISNRSRCQPNAHITATLRNLDHIDTTGNVIFTVDGDLRRFRLLSSVASRAFQSPGYRILLAQAAPPILP